jgi:hypothetical protein
VRILNTQHDFQFHLAGYSGVAVFAVVPVQRTPRPEGHLNAPELRPRLRPGKIHSGNRVRVRVIASTVLVTTDHPALDWPPWSTRIEQAYYRLGNSDLAGAG